MRTAAASKRVHWKGENRSDNDESNTTLEFLRVKQEKKREKKTREEMDEMLINEQNRLLAI